MSRTGKNDCCQRGQFVAAIERLSPDKLLSALQILERLLDLQREREAEGDTPALTVEYPNGGPR